jgi:hypothetical protein
MGIDLKGSGRGLTEVLSWTFHRETEGIEENLGEDSGSRGRKWIRTHSELYRYTSHLDGKDSCPNLSFCKGCKGICFIYI